MANREKRWAPGDVIGCCIDLEARTVSFYRNGKSLGVAFENVRAKEEGMAYFPTVSLSFSEQCLMNFGALPIRYPVPGYELLQLDAEIYTDLATYLVDCIGRLVPFLGKVLSNSKHLTDWAEGQKEASPSNNDVLLVFANIMEVFAPLMCSQHTATALYTLLLSLEETELGHLFQALSLCFVDEKEISVFLKSLLGCIVFHSRIASWVPPSNGSTPMVQLFHRLARIDLVASFLEKHPEQLSSYLERILDSSLPNSSDLGTIFSPLPEDIDEILLPDVATFPSVLESIRENEQAIYQLVKYLLLIPGEQPLAGCFRVWLCAMLKRNKGRVRDSIPSDLNNLQTLFNVYTSLLLFLEEHVPSESIVLPNVDRFLLSRASDAHDMIRIGGTFSHLSSSNEVEDDAVIDNELVLEMFYSVALLAHLGVAKALKAVEDNKQTNEKLFKEITTKSLDASLKQKRRGRILQCLWDHSYWLRQWNTPLIWKKVVRIAASVEFMSSLGPVPFKYVPEFFYAVMCEVEYPFSGTTPALLPEGLGIYTSVLIHSISSKEIQSVGK